MRGGEKKGDLVLVHDGAGAIAAVGADHRPGVAELILELPPVALVGQVADGERHTCAALSRRPAAADQRGAAPCERSLYGLPAPRRGGPRERILPPAGVARMLVKWGAVCMPGGWWGVGGGLLRSSCSS